ncbi:MAG TPA: hypothetical protein VK509_21180, partial [Polyangiales bacterium]|nr:hypothetical protein [Polyangiales bacterium]
DWNAEAATPLDAVAVFARVADRQPYLVVTATNGLGSELAQLDSAGRYRVIQRAGGPISGPVAAGGRTWLAFDGRLAELRGNAEVVRSEETALVTCVGRSGSLAYACTNTELVRLHDGALGERLFGLDELEPPELSALDPALAERCNLQWLRFRVDLVAAGIVPNDDGGDGTPDRGTRDGGARDGGSADASGGGEHAPNANAEDDGCSIGGVGSSVRGDRSHIGRGLLAGLIAAGLARLRRRRLRNGLDA